MVKKHRTMRVRKLCGQNGTFLTPAPWWADLLIWTYEKSEHSINVPLG